MTPHFFAIIFCLLYLISAALFYMYLKNSQFLILRLARWALTIGVVAHWGILISYLSETEVFFPTSTPQSILAISAFVATICLLLSARRTSLLVIVFLLPVICLSFVFLHFVSGFEVLAKPPSPWLWTHVLLTLLGEAFYFIAAVASIVYLLIERKLQRREVSQVFSMLSSLPALDRFLSELLLGGFVFLTLGMSMGFVFAGRFWEAGWLLDPKVLFCVLTWIVYATIHLLRIISVKFLGRRTAIAAVIGFVTVIFLSVGVDVLFPSQHQNIQMGIETK